MPAGKQLCETSIDNRVISAAGTPHALNLASRGSARGLYVVWNITTRCNLACAYCYAARAGGCPVPRLEEGTIILDRFLHSPFNAFTFVFHGGEPLLYFDRIREWICYGETVAHRLGKHVSFRMQSNITLLTHSYAGFLADHRVRIGTSLDGWDQLNSKTRTYPDGRSSFNDTLRALDVLRRYQENIGVICVVTRHNLPQLSEVMDFLRTVGFSACTLSIFSPAGRGEKNKNDLAARDSEVISTLIAVYRKMLAEEQVWPIDPLVSLTRKLLNPSKHIHQCYPCGAGVTQVSVGLDSHVFPCDLFFPDMWDCGSLRDQTLEAIMEGPQMARFRRRAMIIDCVDCRWATVCGGGCAFTAAYEGDLYRRGTNCRILREILPEMEREISKDLFRTASKFSFKLV